MLVAKLTGDVRDVSPWIEVVLISKCFHPRKAVGMLSYSRVIVLAFHLNIYLFVAPSLSSVCFLSLVLSVAPRFVDDF